jgi:hypothetical protein
MTEADSKYGYFSYGAVGTPVTEYDALKAELKPIFADYLKLVPGNENEFKHADFKRILFTDRGAIAERIARALVDRGGFVSGYCVPPQSFVMEHVRDAVMEERDALPDDTTQLYREAVEDLRQMYYSKGEKSELLSALLTLPISACAHMLGALNCPFRVKYDPRERREDLSVRDKIEGLSQVMARMSPQVRGLFRGLDVSTSSDVEIGLQLADLVAGETREFLAACPEMMTYGATRKIISQESNEECEAIDVVEMEGTPPFAYKVGAMSEMTEGMLDRFLRPDSGGRSVFHHFCRRSRRNAEIWTSGRRGPRGGPGGHGDVRRFFCVSSASRWR